MRLLEGKRALIVGGGSGIGRAVAEAYAREGARTSVMEWDSAKCEALEKELPDTVVSRGDATSVVETRAAVDAAVRAFGGLDVLINCVGLFDFYTGLSHIDPERLDEAFGEAFVINVKSQLISVRMALPALTESRGRVILTTSTSGFYPGRGGILYVATKFAVRGAVISLAHELAPDVTVNGVAPGGTLDTDLRGMRSLNMDARRLSDRPDRAADLRGNTPLAVAMSAHDHAGSYVFLGSDLAQGMTGTFLHPDGGMAVKS